MTQPILNGKFVDQNEIDSLKEGVRYFFRLMDEERLVRRRWNSETDKKLGEIAKLVWDEGGI